MKRLSLALPKIALGVLLASSVTAAVAASAQPAQAGVQVSIGIGGAYAPGYHWYSWRDAGGWHRQWVPIGWAPPVVYETPAYAYGPSYAQPVYAPPIYAQPVYAQPAYGRRDWDRDRRDRR